MSNSVQTRALERTRLLLDPRWQSVSPNAMGYIDVLGDSEPECHRAIQRMMRTRTYSAVYQVGRDAVRHFTRFVSKVASDDRDDIIAALGLHRSTTVLDIGCGPGNFTGLFGTVVGSDGLAIGLDASHQMLRVGVEEHAGGSIAYIRGDAEHLPFLDDSVDAVACLAALYLLNDPFGALGEMYRVLRPGGKLVILTSLAPGHGRNSLRSRALGAFSGLRMFERDEVVNGLSERGFEQIDQRTARLSQRVIAVKPSVQT